MPRLHHLDSRYARLTAEAIDLALESVRDATEVLVGTDELCAQDLLRIARSVLEAEQLYEREPACFAEPEQPARGHWTLACMAERFAAAVEHLRERGATQAAERAEQQGALLLRQIASSATRSPLLDYAHVLRALIAVAPHGKPREKLDLQRRYLAEDLRYHQAEHALSGLLDIGITHLQLGQHALAFDIISHVLRHDPTAVDSHVALAEALTPDFPELAGAAAQRALLLATRNTSEGQRAAARAVIDHTRARRAQSQPEAGAALLQLLQDKPGKRARSGLPALCESLVPEVLYVVPKPPEPLPDATSLAQLRRELQSLPRPLAGPVHAAGAPAARRT